MTLQPSPEIFDQIGVFGLSLNPGMTEPSGFDVPANRPRQSGGAVQSALPVLSEILQFAGS
jgi:hypothetical protein